MHHEPATSVLVLSHILRAEIYPLKNAACEAFNGKLKNVFSDYKLGFNKDSGEASVPWQVALSCSINPDS